MNPGRTLENGRHPGRKCGLVRGRLLDLSPFRNNPSDYRNFPPSILIDVFVDVVHSNSFSAAMRATSDISGDRSSGVFRSRGVTWKDSEGPNRIGGLQTT